MRFPSQQPVNPQRPQLGDLDSRREVDPLDPTDCLDHEDVIDAPPIGGDHVLKSEASECQPPDARRMSAPTRKVTPPQPPPRTGIAGVTLPGHRHAASAAAPTLATMPTVPAARRFRAVLRGVPPWSVSFGLHLCGLLVLAYWTLLASQESRPQVLIASAVEATELEVQELAEFEIDQLEVVELQDVSLDMPMLDPGQIELGSIAALPADAELAVPSISSVATYEIGTLFGDRGEGMSTVGEGLGAASFFGAKAQGSRFVFVVDNSNSMGKGRFETALDELMKTVDGMAPYQYFYVVFFSDTAYPLFHPEPAQHLVRATDENKQKLRRWLGTVEMCLKTKGEEALKIAFGLQPDVIYILGDGRFTDRAGAMLVAPHKRTIPVHTLGMEVDAIGKREFQAIAKANRGTYRNVTASRLAQTMARTKPITRNWRRGYVWGITLPDTDMARKRRP